MSVLFETATFDGIVGLSFPKLALSKEFSFLSCLAGVMGDSGPERFAFFLADDESGRGSELAIGGHNPAHLLSPLSWVPVSDPQDGHWKVAMSAVTISGVQLAACDDGACEGIVDTGTSHLGVPREDLRELVLRLSRPAEETTDCRRVEGDEVVIQLSGLNLTLSPWEYMRPLPLRAGTFLNKDHLEEWVTVPLTNGSTPVEILLSEDGNETVPDSFTCTPRLFPVVLKPGKKIFLLGEPVLQRYYSVFDWGSESIAFGLADQRPQETASNDFDDSTLLQLSVLPEEGTVRVDPKFAVMSGEGLEDATSVSLSLGAAAF
uniref:Peptidase A1 domain-containing protein n=1 Tax=Alexandrium andersonii TaxID=327968 RepID=A0A7S2AIC3_9DINO